jgi:hypothetical protein
MEVLIMQKAVLPHCFYHGEAEGLVRMGKDFDGGYVVPQCDVAAADMLLSLGINDDWSFEEDFVAKNDVPVIAYDASVSEQVFKKRLRRSLYQVFKFSRVRRAARLLRSYRHFFSGQRQHIEKFVGVSYGDRFVSLEQVLQTLDSDAIYVKMDIEGSEYRTFETLIAHQDRFTGLAIELHDCDLHLHTIKDFIARFQLPIAHIHANNYAPLDQADGLPLALEITFSKHAQFSAVPACYPRALDMPNNPDAADYLITLTAADKKGA